jgi:hypothetical protein
MAGERADVDRFSWAAADPFGVSLPGHLFVVAACLPVAVILPASVLTTHLESCAAELSTAMPPDDLERVLAQLVSGQRHIAATLSRLSALQTGPLAEVLAAASRAASHAADALAEGEHLFD